jgi:hypothetical protein
LQLGLSQPGGDDLGQPWDCDDRTTDQNGQPE